MPRYSVTAQGKTVKFKAESEHDAKRQAHRMNPYYSDLKRLDSHWWLLMYPVGFLLGWFFMSILVGVV